LGDGACTWTVGPFGRRSLRRRCRSACEDARGQGVHTPDDPACAAVRRQRRAGVGSGGVDVAWGDAAARVERHGDALPTLARFSPGSDGCWATQGEGRRAHAPTARATHAHCSAVLPSRRTEQACVLVCIGLQGARRANTVVTDLREDAGAQRADTHHHGTGVSLHGIRCSWKHAYPVPASQSTLPQSEVAGWWLFGTAVGHASSAARLSIGHTISCRWLLLHIQSSLQS
jgi:hypothetical protein